MWSWIDLDHCGQQLHICEYQFSQLAGGVLGLVFRLRHPIRRDATTFWSGVNGWSRPPECDFVPKMHLIRSENCIMSV